MRMKRLARLALLAAAALIVFVIEAQIPPLTPVPGIKLGLANVVTLFALALMGVRDAAIVLFIRIFAGSLLLGQLSALPYSLAGGVLCLVVMAPLMRVLSKKQLWAVSAAGAIAHNAAQLCVAAVLTSTTGIFLYAPVLLASAIVTGVFTGLAAQFTAVRLERTPLFARDDACGKSGGKKC